MAADLSQWQEAQIERKGGNGLMTTVALKWTKYAKIRWNPDWCKRCHICVEACPRQALVLRDDAIVQLEGCDRTGLCQRLCPDLAIEVIEPRSKEGQR